MAIPAMICAMAISDCGSPMVRFRPDLKSDLAMPEHGRDAHKSWQDARGTPRVMAVPAMPRHGRDARVTGRALQHSLLLALRTIPR